MSRRGPLRRLSSTRHVTHAGPVTWPTPGCSVQRPPISAAADLLDAVAGSLSEGTFGGLAADAVAAALLQVFFAAVGAAGSVAAVLGSAPSLFAFCGIQIFGHLGLVLLVGRVVPKLLARLLKRQETEESPTGFALRDLLSER